MASRTLISTIAIASVLLAGVIPTVSIAQDSHYTQSINLWGQPLRIGEIRVVQEMSFGEEERRIQRAEEDLFNMFNELNESDTFDIECTQLTTYNVQVSKRICEPAFLLQLRAQQLTLHSLEYNTSSSRAPLQPKNTGTLNQLTGNLAIEAAKQYQSFQNEMHRIAMENLEFREAIKLIDRLWLAKTTN